MSAKIQNAENPTEPGERPAARPPLSIRISEELDAQLKAAVETLELPRSKVATLSIERGLPILLAQLRDPTAA